MIGYRVGPQELRRRIREHDPNWLAQAESGEEPEWSRVKDVFVNIQHFKCGYYEHPMPRPQRRVGAAAAGQTWGGRREYDLEHFRPQRQVKRWPTATSGLAYEFETGEDMDGGYPWLAHDCLNYLVSCKTCNQDNKKTCFPVSGPRGTNPNSVRQLNQSERPFLVNPVGTSDVPPGGTDRLPRFPGGTARLPRPQAEARKDHHRSLRPQLARRADSRALQPDHGDVAVSRAAALGRSTGTARGRPRDCSADLAEFAARQLRSVFQITPYDRSNRRPGMLRSGSE